MGYVARNVSADAVRQALWEAGICANITYGTTTGTTEVKIFEAKGINLANINELYISGQIKVSGGTATLKLYAGAGTSVSVTETGAAFDWNKGTLDVSGISTEQDIYVTISATVGDTISVNTVTVGRSD